MEDEKQKEGEVKEEAVEKKEEDSKVKAPEAKAPAKRLIVIETDGNTAGIIRADVAGKLELWAILKGITDGLKPTVKIGK